MAKRRKKKKKLNVIQGGSDAPVLKDEHKFKKDTEPKTTQFVILCGNIGTGKTTAAMQMVAAHGFYRLSHDDILTMMRGYDYNKDDVGMYHDIEKMIVGAMVKYRKDIVIDRTNMTRADRMRWIELAKYYDYYANHIQDVKGELIFKPYNRINIKVMDFGQGDDDSLNRVVEREIKKAGLHKVCTDPDGCDCNTIRQKWEQIYGFMYNGYERPELDEGMYSIKYMDTGEVVTAEKKRGET